jgi:hypothetical protein
MDNPVDGEQIETEPSPYNNTPPEDGYTDEQDGEWDDPTTVEPPTSVTEIGEDLESVTGIGPTRAETFRTESFETATDLWFASDNTLESIDGIGPRAVEQIRSHIGSVDDDSE